MASLALGLTGLGFSGGSSILGAITAHHKQAVAAEANNLNAAVPGYVKQIQTIIQAYNQGQLSISDASMYLDQAVDDYYSAVAGIIQGDRNCDYTGKGTGYCSHKGKCNGPCCVGCNFIVPWNDVLKNWLKGTKPSTNYGYVKYLPGNQLVLGPINAHAGFNGYPAITLSLVAQPVTQVNTTTPRQDSPIPVTNPLREDTVNPNAPSFNNGTAVGSMFGDPGYKVPVYQQVVPNDPVAVDSSNDRASGLLPINYNLAAPLNATAPAPQNTPAATQPNYMLIILILLAVLAAVVIGKGL